MVSVQDEHGIGNDVRQVRIIRFSNDNPNIAFALEKSPNTKELQRQVSKVYGDDFASRANRIR